MTLQELIAQRQELKRQITTIETTLKPLKDQLKQFDLQILNQMDALGVQRTGTDVANVLISESTVPQVDPAQWEEVFNWIVRNDAWDLVRKQLNATAYESRVTAGEELPGVTPFVKRSVQVRAV